MRRHHLLWGCVMMALGLGVLAGTWISSKFWAYCLAVVLLVTGFCISRRK